MSRVELFDETFTPGVATPVDLVVAPTRRSCRLLLHDSTRSHFVGLVEFPWTVRAGSDWGPVFAQLREAYPWLASEFQSVSLLWDACCYTLLPREYYLPEEAKSILQAVAPVASLDAVYVGELDEEALLLYTVPSEMLNAVRDQWGEFAVLHSTLALCRLAQEDFRKATGFLLYLATDACAAILVQEGELLASVPFWPSCAEDVLYRLAGICEANGLVLSELSYRLCGPGFEPSVVDATRGDAPLVATEAVDDLLWQYMQKDEGRWTIGERGVSYLLGKRMGEYLPLFGAMECV